MNFGSYFTAYGKGCLISDLKNVQLLRTTGYFLTRMVTSNAFGEILKLWNTKKSENQLLLDAFKIWNGFFAATKF